MAASEKALRSQLVYNFLSNSTLLSVSSSISLPRIGMAGALVAILEHKGVLGNGRWRLR